MFLGLWYSWLTLEGQQKKRKAVKWGFQPLNHNKQKCKMFPNNHVFPQNTRKRNNSRQGRQKHVERKNAKPEPPNPTHPPAPRGKTNQLVSFLLLLLNQKPGKRTTQPLLRPPAPALELRLARWSRGSVSAAPVLEPSPRRVDRFGLVVMSSHSLVGLFLLSCWVAFLSNSDDRCLDLSSGSRIFCFFFHSLFGVGK